MRPIDNYFLIHEEPIKSCLQFLRSHILAFDAGITEKWLYGMPFYYYNGKRVCYLWIDKKLRQPYLGIVDGRWIEDPELIAGSRSRMKIFLIDPERDVPVRKMDKILKKVIDLYK